MVGVRPTDAPVLIEDHAGRNLGEKLVGDAVEVAHLVVGEQFARVPYR